MLLIVRPLAPCQVSFFLGVVPVFAAWLYSEYLQYKKNVSSSSSDQIALLEDGSDHNLIESSPSVSVACNILRFLTLDKSFLLANRHTLRAMSEFCVLLMYYFLCDRTDLLGEAKKIGYYRDLFLFIYFTLVVVASITSFKKIHNDASPVSGKKMMYLNRHQTEEWKGWMQVLFIMFHYFDATEILNAVRVFIAGYVWMTGFGNFSYYYIRKDFSLARFVQMMWRINFLVFFSCILLNDKYISYYICPMHTLFTLMVFGALRIFNKHNDKGSVIFLKFLACFLVIVLIWEIPGVFNVFWSPFKFLIGIAYIDPVTSKLVGPLHEWHKRSGLDRYIWIIGMIYAYYHPTVERWMEKVEESEVKFRILIKSVVVIISLVVGYMWLEFVYKLPRATYEKYHPYTSWIPITVYICLRNVTQYFRCYSLTLFAWLGKITLETYITQFNIWLRYSSRADVDDIFPNKVLLSLIPNYPLLNFMLTTSIFIAVSFRVFQLTSTLKSTFVPSHENKRLGQNLAAAAALGTVIYVVAWLLLFIF